MGNGETGIVASGAGTCRNERCPSGNPVRRSTQPPAPGQFIPYSPFPIPGFRFTAPGVPSGFSSNEVRA